MLYIFAGHPRNGLNASGLSHLIEDVEELGILQHGKVVQYRKEGKYALSEMGEERIGDTDYVLSPRLVQDGITWDWFKDAFTFGNGVFTHGTTAGPLYKTVIQGTNLSEDEYLLAYGPTPAQFLVKERKHIKHDGWMKYEARWALDANGVTTCPQENHVVRLTWFSTIYPLPQFAYDRIRSVIENDAELLYPEEYEMGKHISTIRKYDGRFAYRMTNGIV